MYTRTKLSAGIVLLLVTGLLSGCFNPQSLTDPVNQYLANTYGIKKKNVILTADNNWLELGHHVAEVEIYHPYHTAATFEVDRETHAVREVDDVFTQEFKGAYVEQKPDVVAFIDTLIAKYRLETSGYYDSPIDDIIPYYLDFSFEQQQEETLKKEFLQSLSLPMDTLLPTLIASTPRHNTNHVGVTNFVFLYDLNQDEVPPPRVMDLYLDFQTSGVLTEGIYGLMIQMGRKTEDGMGTAPDLDEPLLFTVDASGNFTVLPVEKEF
ncbi:hypothetical protein I6J18_18335 [Peribacillus psychrosaccharolyticus]|uniref:Lipoprotein n=1 Tax=Peribacillus psychrosaccharolyticus TaxID=1407 RepID=A0A974RZK0_PERPY|nr:hypothetical protein [Peribacillus psychrosaccharolyticus]MEC2054740.1 hypothetical protein [Peribacillus psychrosaccharolyticus]MED3744033.1 hypothetical protein [Peribacillus psychrosaccharolyticus]QQS99530.1 hypothetical protein I6J18_18335 [Peribacillus psychrosaccharolyticus]